MSDNKTGDYLVGVTEWINTLPKRIFEFIRETFFKDCDGCKAAVYLMLAGTAVCIAVAVIHCFAEKNRKKRIGKSSCESPEIM